MRALLDEEMVFLRKIVSLKKQKELGSLDLGRLLKEKLDCFALKCELEPKPTITIYEAHKNGNIDISFDTFISIVDFIYYIEELEEKGYAKLLEISHDNLKPGLLYDKEKYSYDELNDTFNSKLEGSKVTLYGKEYTLTDVITPLDKQKIYNKVAFHLYRCCNSIIYPLKPAEDFLQNGCLSIEDRRLKKQLRISRVAILTSICIGVISPFLSKCTDKNEVSNIYYIITQSDTISKPLKVLEIDSVKHMLKTEKGKNNPLNNEIPNF